MGMCKMSMRKPASQRVGLLSQQTERATGLAEEDKKEALLVYCLFVEHRDRDKGSYNLQGAVACLFFSLKMTRMVTRATDCSSGREDNGARNKTPHFSAYQKDVQFLSWTLRNL